MLSLRRPAQSCAALLLTAGLALGCHKSAERESQEAAKAAAVANAHPSPATADEAKDERADVTKAVERERGRYRELLTKEIGWVDRRAADMDRDAKLANGDVRAAKDADVNAVREWRERLKQDLDAVENPPAGTDWSVLKMRIQRDLDEDRPVAIPRTYEKSYGI